MKIIFRVILLIVFQYLLAVTANAVVLANEQLMTPLIPHSKRGLSIPLNVDPSKPVWVVYQLVGVSAVSRPEGEVVLDSSFEMVALPMGDSVVVFRMKDLDVVKATKGLSDQLSEKIGQRKPEELRKMFGDDMYAAYEAIKKNEGSYVTGNIIKEYETDGKRQLVLLATVDRAKGIQPVAVNVIVGQGEIPAEYEKFGKKSIPAEKIIVAVISFAIAGFWLLRRRKN